MSIEEIASELGVSYQAVQAMCKRAMDKFKRNAIAMGMNVDELLGVLK